MARLKKLKGSTLIETLIAMILLMVFISLYFSLSNSMNADLREQETFKEFSRIDSVQFIADQLGDINNLCKKGNLSESQDVYYMGATKQSNFERIIVIK